MALLRESNVYEFSPRGLDLSAQWKIQAHDEPLEKIAVQLDPGLQLVTARLGDVSLAWTIEPLPDDAGTRAVLSLPEPIRDTDAILRLGALAPFTLDHSFRLPRVHPEGLFWQEGSTTLIVPDPLVIERLSPIDCSQTAVSPLPEPRVGETLQFQNFGADATIDLSLSRRSPRMQLVTGTAVELGSGQMTARVVADFHTDDTAQFTLEADVSKLWIIDSVEASPADALADWNLEGQQGKPRKLRIWLSKAPSVANPVRLVVNGRRLRTFLTHQWKVGDLLPLRFTTPKESKRLASIQAADPYDLILSNAEQITRRNAQYLTPAELELFATPPAGLLFEDNAAADELEIALQTRKPTFSGTVSVEADVNKNRLQEIFLAAMHASIDGHRSLDSATIECRDISPRWSLSSENNDPLAARKWSKSEQNTAGLNPAGETWELTFHKPRSTPFEIIGMREVPFSGSQAVCLASLPEVADQHGTLVIRSMSNEWLRIDNRHLKSSPSQPAPADRYSTVRGNFRFDPIRDVALSNEPAIIISAATNDSLPPVWVRNYRLESWHEPQNKARHLATFELQNTGSNSMQFVLPSGVSTKDLRGVWIDNKPADWQPEGSNLSNADNTKDDTFSVTLPATKQFPKICISFVTDASGLGTVGSLSPPLLEVKAPVLAGSWTVWLPPGFEVVGTNQCRPAPSATEITLSRRLFGPLGRNPEQTVFNPLMAKDWFALFNNEIPSQLAENQSSLSSDNPPGFQPVDTQGWTAQCMEISGTQSVTLKYVHRRSQQYWAAMIFLFTMAASYWNAAKHPVFFSIMTGILGISAIVLHDAYVPFASAATLGMLVSFVLLSIRFHRKNNARIISPADGPSDESSSSAGKTTTIAAQTGIIFLMVAAVLLFSANIRAEESPEKPTLPASTDYRVFVPIDAEKKPIGDKFYLPENFYNELYRRAALAAEKPQGWLLASAVYRGNLQRETATGRLSLDAIKARYDLNVYGRMVQVKIPFRQENADLIPDSVMIDGRPIEPQWEPDGSALKFDVEQPGKYRLELAFHPSPRLLASSAGFEMSIPRLAQSRLELTFPAETQGIEVQSAIGPVNIESAPPRLAAELGPVNRLVVHWPEITASKATASAVEADQLTWLKVQPGSVALDVRFKLHIAEAQIQRLQLAADPRLRLLPMQGKDAPSIQIRSDAGKQQIITFQWNRPLANEAAIDISFLLTGTSGVGKFRLPQIELLDVRTANRWMAISVDPILQYESQPSVNMSSTTAADFLKNWGSANPPPVQAYRIENNKVDWSLSTKPRQSETSAQQTLALSFGQNNIQAYFDAQLTVASGYVFQYQLSAPKTMNISKVSVSKEGVELSARWSQDQEGTVTIFLSGPADGKQHLSFFADIPLEFGEKTSLPTINLKQCRVQSTTVQIFRRPEASLELIQSDSEGSRPSLAEHPAQADNSLLPTEHQSAAGENKDEGITDRGRLMKTFYLENDNPLQAEVLATANKPNFDAKQVTRLYPKGQQWIVQTDFQIDVKDGLADQFLINVPDSWKEPYSIDPPATLKTLEISGESKQLLVQPRSAVRGKYNFSIAGFLDIEPGESPAAPDIVLLKTNIYSRWLLLPRQVKGQIMGWETRGLRPAELPASLATPADQKDYLFLEIVGDAPQAMLRAPAALPGPARVNRAGIQLAWQQDGLCHGTASFDLDPGGRTFCPLNLPQGYELVHAAIDGQPITPFPLGSGKWKLPLASESSQQLIEVIFRGELSEPLRSGPRDLSAPSLGDLPVTETTWTALSPPSLIPQTGNDEKTSRRPPRLDTSQNAAYFTFDGAMPSITVSYQSTNPFGAGRSFFASFCLAGMIFLFILGIRSGTWATIIKDRPHAVGIAAGLAWWCWLWPSILGLVAAIFFLFAWWHARRRDVTENK